MESADMVQGAPEEGFLDVAANALAVVLFVTMLLLITISATTTGRVIPPHGEQVTIPEPTLGVLGPFRLFYVVSADGITYLDLSPLRRGFLAGERSVSSDIGKASMTIDRQGLSTRDLNAFSVELELNPTEIANRATPLNNETEAAAILNSIADQLSTSQAGAITVIVASEGASRFARLFHKLQEANISLRMARMPTDWTLTFKRKAIDFSTRIRAR